MHRMRGRVTADDCIRPAVPPRCHVPRLTPSPVLSRSAHTRGGELPRAPSGSAQYSRTVKVLSVVGARPSWSSSRRSRLPFAARGHEHVIVHTGQHYDAEHLRRLLHRTSASPSPTSTSASAPAATGARPGPCSPRWTGARRAPAGLGAGLRRHQLDPGRGASRREDAHAGRPPGGRAAVVQPADAGGAQPGAHRPRRRPAAGPDRRWRWATWPTRAWTTGRVLVGDVMTDVLPRGPRRGGTDKPPAACRVSTAGGTTSRRSTGPRTPTTPSGWRGIIGALAACRARAAAGPPAPGGPGRGARPRPRPGFARARRPMPYPDSLRAVMSSARGDHRLGRPAEGGVPAAGACTTVRTETEWTETVDLGLERPRRRSR